MNDSNTEFVGSYEINCATISVKKGEALDYARMRAAQLSALTRIMGEGLNEASPTVRKDVAWLASTLCDELDNLLEIVAEDERCAS